MIELLFAGLIGIGLPVRALRRRRHPTPVRFGRYLVETTLLVAVLGWLLWRNGVPPARVGLAVDSVSRFTLQLALCVLVVVGPDAWSAWRIARTTKPGDPLPEPDPLFADVVAGRHVLATFVAAMVVGAIWEELCFRATILMLVPQTPGGLLVGVAGGAIVFGAQHLRSGTRRALYACGYGVMFAALYLLTRNLVAVVIAHAAGNILAALQWTPRLERERRRAAAAPASMFIG